jgi:hypothetical protein
MMQNEVYEINYIYDERFVELYRVSQRAVILWLYYVHVTKDKKT